MRVTSSARTTSAAPQGLPWEEEPWRGGGKGRESQRGGEWARGVCVYICLSDLPPCAYKGCSPGSPYVCMSCTELTGRAAPRAALDNPTLTKCSRYGRFPFKLLARCTLIHGRICSTTTAA